MEAQAGIKIAERNINNLRYADDTTLMAESKEELKSLLMKVKEEREKAGLKLNIQKTKIMASGPIISWQIDREAMETVTDFIFLGSKITAGGDCSHEIKRPLLLGRKTMTNLDSILKCRDITLLTKVLYCAVLCLVAWSCPTLCGPVDCSPPGSSVHGDSPGKNTGVGCSGLPRGLTKVHLVKAMIFPVVMYACESWTIKKAERQRIDAFEL